jgi:hypothetical protein
VSKRKEFFARRRERNQLLADCRQRLREAIAHIPKALRKIVDQEISVGAAVQLVPSDRRYDEQVAACKSHASLYRRHANDCGMLLESAWDRVYEVDYIGLWRALAFYGPVEIPIGLQADPKLRRCLEQSRKPERCICGDGTLPPDNFIQSIERDP